MTQLMSQIYLKVGGKYVESEMMDAIDSIEVDQSLLLPDMLSIHLRDSALKWIDSDTFDFGKTVDIEVGPKEETERTTKEKLFSGEITAIEPEFDKDHGATIVIRGYDKSHRLHRGKKTRTFLKMKDSDLVSKIAGECKLSADADATAYKHEYIFQDNQTNMEFLQDRARRVGYFVYVKENKLCFKKPAAVGTTGPDLELGADLLDFKVRVTTAEQADKGIAHGWDQKQKQAVVATIPGPRNWLKWGGLTKFGGDAAKSAFGSAEAVVDNRPLSNVDEAKAMAQSVLDEQLSAFIQAEGTCNGNPDVVAGAKVTIKEVGSRFSGSYLVTRAVHYYDKDGYFTRFEIGGRRANTLGQILAGNGSSRRSIVTALVTNLNDPENLGRIKVKYPSLSKSETGAEIESDWARLVNPMAGAERGIQFLPEVNDEVLVVFENDDVHRPYILGALWSSTDKPPQPNNQVVSQGKVIKRIIKTRAGHTITLDDTEGKEKISIIDNTEQNSIEINSEKGKESIVIKLSDDHKVTMNTQGINMETKGKLVLKSTGDMEITAQGNMKITSTGNTDIKATGNIKTDSTGNTDINSTANVKVKGNMASIDGGPMTEIKGIMVKIN